jgi:uncharacterized protein YabE (DUF348 family)
MLRIASIVDAVRDRPGQSAVSLALAGLALVYLAGQKTVSIDVDGERIVARTHARTVAAVLRDVGLTVGPWDRVSPGLHTSLSETAEVRLERAHHISLELDGEAAEVWSADRVPANVLAGAGVRLYPGDQIYIDGLRIQDPGEALDAPAARIRHDSALPFQVESGSRRDSLATTAPTVGQALAMAGIVLYSGDTSNPGYASRVDAATFVRHRPAIEITLLADGQEIRLRAAGDTVADALTAAGLIPVGLDYTVPSLGQPVPPDGVVRLVRVREEVLVEQVPLPFETVYEPIPDLEIDNQRLLESGAYGVSASRVWIRSEDGEEVGRIVEGSWVAVEPQPRTLGYGTQIVIRTLVTDDGTIEYWRAVRMWATSYAEKFFPRDWPYLGITASGLPLTKGLVAIDRRYIPFGTRMYVPGYGFALAADTGSNIRGRWIDLGYDNDNYVPWAQYVTVYFLTPVPDTVVWIIP